MSWTKWNIDKELSTELFIFRGPFILDTDKTNSIRKFFIVILGNKGRFEYRFYTFNKIKFSVLIRISITWVRVVSLSYPFVVWFNLDLPPEHPRARDSEHGQTTSVGRKEEVLSTLVHRSTFSVEVTVTGVYLCQENVHDFRCPSHSSVSTPYSRPVSVNGRNGNLNVIINVVIPLHWGLEVTFYIKTWFSRFDDLSIFTPFSLFVYIDKLYSLWYFKI